MTDDYKAQPDPYTWPGTDVLINRFGVRDCRELEQIESDLCAFAETKLLYNPVPGKFDLAHLREIHRRLLGDVYPWAGEIRTVRITKGQSVFAYPENIESSAEKLFSALERERRLKGLDRNAFVRRLAFYMAELNAIHPFREGNGRTLRVFFSQLAHEAGYTLRFDRTNAHEVLKASVTSFNGDNSSLEKLLDSIVE